MDGHLWNELFTEGYCPLQDLPHSQADCPEAPDVHFTPSHTSAKLSLKDPRQTSAEICRLFCQAPLRFKIHSQIFNAVADALEWCLATEGVEALYHYLNDFAVVGPPGSEQYYQSSGLLKAICSELGIPLAPEKQAAGPSTTIEFLGIITDTSWQELRLRQAGVVTVPY